MTTPPLVPPFGGQPPAPPQQQQQQQAQAARDVNTASLCRIGQETVQDIVIRTMEIFQLLRNMQLPNGVTYHPPTHQDRLGKLQEHLRMLSVLFRKLRLVFDKCNENCAGMDPISPEVKLAHPSQRQPASARTRVTEAAKQPWRSVPIKSRGGKYICGAAQRCHVWNNSRRMKKAKGENPDCNPEPS